MALATSGHSLNNVFPASHIPLATGFFFLIFLTLRRIVVLRSVLWITVYSNNRRKAQSDQRQYRQEPRVHVCHLQGILRFITTFLSFTQPDTDCGRSIAE